ncbi:MAG: Rv2175c family DNA-binding protein [Scytonema sp. PMC 1069.18]|nr:Rv2175c family DNA-binding protein [Scytonema sp. PMC 1069.18]MEC4881403.1 Rv2175c family DNA-binding protein [Scytonema sp. PMC 1070.18]
MNATTFVEKSKSQHKQELIEQAAKALNRLSTAEIEYWVSRIKNTPMPIISKAETNLAAKLGVAPISEEEQRDLENEAFKDFFEWRQQILSNCYTASEVAQLLGVKSRQTPHDRRRHKSLIAVQDNGIWKFPKWQFDPTGPHGVLPGLPDVLKALDVPDFSKISWLIRPNSALNGLTPVEALKKGRKNAVIAEAQAVGVM